MCEYCKTPSKYMAVIESEPRLFLSVTGNCIQIFDEDYPGFIDNIKIKYCPMCGRDLNKRD